MVADHPARRRGDVLVAAIRQATRDELAERGYARVTFEGVARRARTSKPVLYRRYRSRAQMVVDALVTLDLPPSIAETTGSLRGDLMEILTAILARFRHVGIDTYRGIIAEAEDELLDEIMAMTSSVASMTIRRALCDARDRGEIGPAEIPDRVVMTPVALLRHELFFAHGTVDTDTLDELIDMVYLPLVTSLSRK
jgi:AcrR family transcriptional regulator